MMISYRLVKGCLQLSAFVLVDRGKSVTVKIQDHMKMAPKERKAHVKRVRFPDLCG